MYIYVILMHPMLEEQKIFLLIAHNECSFHYLFSTQKSLLWLIFLPLYEGSPTFLLEMRSCSTVCTDLPNIL